MRLDWGPKARQQLTIELVPQTSWFTNMRSILAKADWDKIREQCYKEAEYACEICNDIGPKWPVECHEIWKYNDSKHIQKLVGLIALCPNCHRVKHMGYALFRGKGPEAAAHLAKVNKWSNKKTQTYIRKAFALYHKRSKHKWTLDLTYLKEWAGSRNIKIKTKTEG